MHLARLLKVQVILNEQMQVRGLNNAAGVAERLGVNAATECESDFIGLQQMKL